MKDLLIISSPPEVFIPPSQVDRKNYNIRFLLGFLASYYFINDQMVEQKLHSYYYNWVGTVSLTQTGHFFASFMG